MPKNLTFCFKIQVILEVANLLARDINSVCEFMCACIQASALWKLVTTLFGFKIQVNLEVEIFYLSTLFFESSLFIGTCYCKFV
jgi:hypothetical protein